jgi:hypothetical protein
VSSFTHRNVCKTLCICSCLSTLSDFCTILQKSHLRAYGEKPCIPRRHIEKVVHLPDRTDMRCLRCVDCRKLVRAKVDTCIGMAVTVNTNFTRRARRCACHRFCTRVTPF